MLDEIVVEVLALMLGVVSLSHLAGDHKHSGHPDYQAPPLDSTNHFADKASSDATRLDQHQRPFHEFLPGFMRDDRAYRRT